MKLAILFWFYKEPDICENRLQLLKKYNPNVKIFGLFGGERKEAEAYNARLGKYMEDFYISPHDDPDWKWINGDLMILDWFEKRGKELEWDSIAVVQWDMLVFGSLAEQFPDLKEGEIFLSGLRDLDDVIERQWVWTRKESPERKNYLAFLDYVQERYGYWQRPLCCLFIFQISPRIFFEKYFHVREKEIGMLEYKIPIYAKIFGIPFYMRNLGVWWFDTKIERGKTPMNAKGVEISESFIREELSKQNGFRLFHPYKKIWPTENYN